MSRLQISPKRVVRAVLWYLREISGESSYKRYLEHAQNHHPQRPTMSRREFERWRFDSQEREPQSRCC
jgi:uncharacterized short protein YbdD (DUF466 family)